MIKIFAVPRERDDAMLRWIGMSLRGVSFNEIARREGEWPATVRNAIHRIRDCDLAESGEDPATVRRAYP